MVRKTKIVCTIGPASDSVQTLKELIKNGMDVARLNFSHGTYEEHRERIANIRKAAKAVGKTIAILLDTQGPEIRTKSFKGGEAYLTEGSRVIITTEDVEGTEKRFSITYKELMYDVEIGTNISLDDGLINLKVVGIDKEKGEISTTVLNSGYIKNKKGVNVPNVRVNLPSLTEKDRRDILFGIEHEVDFIAASFVRDTNDVLSMRQLLEENDANYIHIISKIENREAVTNFEQILQASDGIMVARGDLGVEIPPEEVPIVQKKLIEKCNLVGKPVITATQMLDSMQSEPRPTRAEASDVANAILDGTDAIMLSGETAAGKFPVEAVRMMSVIAEKTEPTLDHMSLLQERKRSISMTITDAISQSVTQTALNLDVSSIITPTQSGHSARMIAKYRPEVPIIAVTFDEFVYRQLSLVWGVHAVISKEIESTDELLDEAVKKGLSTKLFHRGSKVIITAGVPVGVSGTTNLMKVHVIGNVIATGQGIGRHYAYGKAVVATSA
ncbi:MAG TPA: pyruvate kinase, partial [Pseudogracilibacillus sp.]|nr:pyruvate kinase [Pseudogracilibacillus sp.]